MKNIFKKINIENFKKSLKETWGRLPVSVLLSVFVFLGFVVKIYVDLGRGLENILDKTILTLVVMFFLSVAVYLLTEVLNTTLFKKWVFQLGTFVFGGLFYIFFEENLFNSFEAESMIYITATMIGIVAAIFVAPFAKQIVNKSVSQESFYNFSFKLVIKTLMSVIIGNVSMLLGFVALGSIFALFGLGFINEGDTFSLWSAFTLSLLAPLFFLANLPKDKQNDLDKIKKNKFYYFLINYIGLPAISIYLLILYAYTVKVLVNFSKWPQGKISWMVIGFSFFGYLIYVASWIFKDKFKPVLFFRKIFPFILIPQIGMLFYAIILRINQHDFTINRYLVVVFGLWLLGISLYFIFSKKKYLGTIFYSLMITIFIISVGPWSVYSFPENRQTDELVQNLKEAGILENGQITPLKKYTDISGKLSGKVYGSIEYLCQFHGCRTLDFLFEKQIKEIKKKHKKKFDERKAERIKNAFSKEELKWVGEMEYRPISNWEIIDELSKIIKVRRYNKDFNYNNSERILSFAIKDYKNFDSMNITGYDVFLRMYSSLGGTKDRDYAAYLDTDMNELKLYKKGKMIETFDFTKVKDFLISQKNIKENIADDKMGNTIFLDKELMTFELENNGLKIKLFINNISIENLDLKEVEKKDREKNNQPKFALSIQPFVDGFVLLKNK